MTDAQRLELLRPLHTLGIIVKLPYDASRVRVSIVSTPIRRLPAAKP